jgi:tetratricopeptide (TPR) repeat protein
MNLNFAQNADLTFMVARNEYFLATYGTMIWGSSMGFVKFSDAIISSELLLEQNEFEKIPRVLGLALSRSQDQTTWQTTQAFLERIPYRVRVESLEVAFLYARTLMFNDELQTLLEFNQQTLEHHGIAKSARIQLECAKSHLALRQYKEARDLLEGIVPHLQDELLGIAWGKLGFALFNLGKPWQEAFHQAVGNLTGVELGYVLFNQGGCLDLCNKGVEARAIWSKALALLKSDIKMFTWTRYNLGMSALRDLEPEAERHFLEAQSLCKNSKNSMVRTAVLNGLAASRRMLGEWFRAEAVYRETIHTSQDSRDRNNSYFGLARTLRLSGRPNEALETLEFALQDPTLNHDQIQISRAMTFLALGQNTAALDALSKVGTLVSVSDQWLFKIAQAEILRRDGNLENAVEILEGLPVETLHAREEARCFPELMQLLYAANKPFPKPLEYVEGITVRVVAQGLLSVRINDRPVNIAPTSRAGELLVYLLEQNGAASIDMISDAMFTHLGIDDRAKARGGIWNLVKTLRGALGWQNSVMALRGTYQLDPNVTWQYDMQEARDKRIFQGEFLKGVYSDWVFEVGRTLEGKADLRRRSSDLN